MIQDPSATCDVCNGSGWVPSEGVLSVRPCACQEGSRRQQRIGAAAIPKRYLHCTLENFHGHLNISLEAAKRRMREFVDCWPVTDNQRGFLLMGNCGVGKTHLAVAVIQELIRAGKPGRFLFSNFQDLIHQIHASFDSEETPSKAEILRPLIDADLLVLDELGSQKPTLFVQDVLYYVINSRYNEEKVTIFTTNYLDDPPGKEEPLEERIGRRIRSRVHEMTERIVLSGEDYRRLSRRVI